MIRFPDDPLGNRIGKPAPAERRSARLSEADLCSAKRSVGDRMTAPERFLRFCAVGIVGFCVDAGLLLAAVGLGVPPLAGRLLSWLVAASTTFALNRVVTFGDAAAAPVWRRWLLFLAANGLGGAVNYGVFGLVLGTAAPTGPRLVAALAAGTLAGLVLNFWLSRRVVFRPAPHTVPGRIS